MHGPPAARSMDVPPPHRGVADADDRFREAYAAVREAVEAAFPDAAPVEAWGMVGWQAPRPPEAVPAEPVGTLDPALVFVGLADRKAGPTLHVWHPGAYDLLDRNAAWLRDAGFKVMKGCLPWTRKAAYPAGTVRRLIEAARAVDA